MTYIDISRIVQTNAPVHFKKRVVVHPADPRWAPNVLVNVSMTQVDGAKAIAT